MVLVIIIFFHLTLSAVGLCLLLSLLLLEVHDYVMHHSACELVDVLFVLLSEAQDVNGVLLSMSRDVLLTKRLTRSTRSTNIL